VPAPRGSCATTRGARGCTPESRFARHRERCRAEKPRNPRDILRGFARRARIKEDFAVSLYVMLSSLSESGRKVLRERPGWIKKVNADVQRMGARVVAQYAVLGPYDFVTIVEAPDNATISRVSVELGARGGVAGMTLAAIPLDEFIERLERGGKRQGKKKR
jgi:uncharacterized protein with GYD domain